MIPVKLIVEGLYSYQKRQEIDFNKLTSAHIFGIFGQVGSGKSTILEAITFAIYGETERLNSKDGRGYNMMNLKSDSLLVEFELIAGTDSKRYLAKATARRNSKRYEDVRTIERKAYVEEHGSWQPIELEELERAVGLSYSNFKRTIIIPQGKFQEFLQLEKKERTNMMKELFSLEKYDLYGKVASLDKRNNEKKQFLEGQLASIGSVSEEQLEELKKKAEELAVMLQGAAQQIAVKRLEIEAFKIVKELATKQEQLKQEQEQLVAKESGIEQRSKALKDYEYCLITFKGLLEQAKQLELAIGQLSNEIETGKAAHKQNGLQLAEKQQKVEALKQRYEAREQELALADELERLSKVRELEIAAQDLAQRAAKGKALIAELELTASQKKEGLEKLQKEVKQEKEGLADLSLLYKVKDWFTVYGNIIQKKEQLRKDKEVVDVQRLELRKNLEQLLENEQISNRKHEELAIEEVQQYVHSKQEQILASTKESEEALHQLKVQEQLGAYASTLVDGEPCPLCGSVHHPLPLQNHNIAVKIEEAKQKKQHLEDEIKRYNSLERQLIALKERFEASDSRIAELTKQHNEVEVQQDAHSRTFEWPSYATEEELKKAFAQAEEAQKRIKEQEKSIELAAEEVKVMEQNLEKYRKLAEELLLEKAAKEGEVRSLRESLQRLAEKEYESSTSEELKQLAKEKRNVAEEIVKAYERLVAELQELKQQEGELVGRISANEATLLKHTEQRSGVNKKVEEKLAESGQRSLLEVKNVLAQSINVEQERTAIQEYYQQRQSIADQLMQNSRDLAGRTYEADAHHKVEQELMQLAEQEAAAQKELGSTENEAATKQALLQQQLTIQKELEDVVNRASELALLKNMMQGNRFIDYVSTTYLENLCRAANTRFYKMTRQRLSLELTPENSFQVRDFMNGGKTRSIKTLSGGQTFQASLSLALALSDNIQRMQSADQNFFFLDEGFGTLDKESLSVVFETLKSLRKENRIVGVISHVDEMQQEIDTYLKIVNYEDRGSIVTTSWV